MKHGAKVEEPLEGLREDKPVGRIDAAPSRRGAASGALLQWAGRGSIAFVSAAAFAGQVAQDLRDKRRAWREGRAARRGDRST